MYVSHYLCHSPEDDQAEQISRRGWVEGYFCLKGGGETRHLIIKDGTTLRYLPTYQPYRMCTLPYYLTISGVDKLHLKWYVSLAVAAGRYDLRERETYAEVP